MFRISLVLYNFCSIYTILCIEIVNIDFACVDYCVEVLPASSLRIIWLLCVL